MALACRSLESVVVSTDSPTIADVSLESGAMVPFLRPSTLASDATSSCDVALHALEEMPGHDWLLLLQPTSPLRTSEDIEGIIAMLEERPAHSALSVSQTHPPIHWALEVSSDGSVFPALHDDRHRRSGGVTFTPNGALYLTQCEWLSQHRRLSGEGTRAYVMPRERSIDIDTEIDWAIAEMLMRRSFHGERPNHGR